MSVESNLATIPVPDQCEDPPISNEARLIIEQLERAGRSKVRRLYWRRAQVFRTAVHVNSLAPVEELVIDLPKDCFVFRVRCDEAELKGIRRNGGNYTEISGCHFVPVDRMLEVLRIENSPYDSRLYYREQDAQCLSKPGGDPRQFFPMTDYHKLYSSSEVSDEGRQVLDEMMKEGHFVFDWGMLMSWQLSAEVMAAIVLHGTNADWSGDFCRRMFIRLRETEGDAVAWKAIGSKVPDKWNEPLSMSNALDIFDIPEAREWMTQHSKVKKFSLSYFGMDSCVPIAFKLIEVISTVQCIELWKGMHERDMGFGRTYEHLPALLDALRKTPSTISSITFSNTSNLHNNLTFFKDLYQIIQERGWETKVALLGCSLGKEVDTFVRSSPVSTRVFF